MVHSMYIIWNAFYVKKGILWPLPDNRSKFLLPLCHLKHFLNCDTCVCYRVVRTYRDTWLFVASAVLWKWHYGRNRKFGVYVVRLLWNWCLKDKFVFDVFLSGLVMLSLSCWCKTWNLSRTAWIYAFRRFSFLKHFCQTVSVRGNIYYLLSMVLVWCFYIF